MWEKGLISMNWSGQNGNVHMERRVPRFRPRESFVFGGWGHAMYDARDPLRAMGGSCPIQHRKENSPSLNPQKGIIFSPGDSAIALIALRICSRGTR